MTGAREPAPAHPFPCRPPRGWPHLLARRPEAAPPLPARRPSAWRLPALGWAAGIVCALALQGLLGAALGDRLGTAMARAERAARREAAVQAERLEAALALPASRR